MPKTHGRDGQIARSLSALLSENHFWRWTLVLLFVAVSYLALTPAPQRGVELGWDKLNHTAAFMALAFAGWLSYPDGRRPTILIIVGLLAYGGAIEIIQLYVPGRSCEWGDVLADTIGIAGGTLVARYLRKAST